MALVYKDGLDSKGNKVRVAVEKDYGGNGSTIGNTSSNTNKQITSVAELNQAVNGGSSSKSTGSTYDPNEYIDKLKNAKIKADVSALKQARDKAISGYESQKADIPQQYQAVRQNVNAQSNQGKLSLAEYMANRGLTSSGASAQAEMNRTATLNSNLASNRTAETNAINDLNTKINDANTSYQNGVAQAKAGAEATAMENYIKQQETAQKLANDIALQQMKDQADQGQYITYSTPDGQTFQVKGSDFMKYYLTSADKKFGYNEYTLPDGNKVMLNGSDYADLTVPSANTMYGYVTVTGIDGKQYSIPKSSITPYAMGITPEQKVTNAIGWANANKTSNSNGAVSQNYINASTEIRKGANWEDVIAKYPLTNSERDDLFTEFKQKHPNPAYVVNGVNTFGTPTDDELAE